MTNVEEGHGRFYVYVLLDAGIVFYIGKGTGERMYDHDREAKLGGKGRKCQRIRKIWKEGRVVEHRVVMRFESSDDALAFENRLVCEALSVGCVLTNKAGGGTRSGTGRDVWQSMTEETRKRCLSNLRPGNHTHKYTYNFTSPDGREHRGVTNLRLFCRAYDLDVRCMRRVFHGENKQYKGWRKLDD